MKITYINHSCFTIETDDTALIFDYYTHGEALFKIISEKKHVYVFSSHIHGDHFNNEIFNWTKLNDNIKYILSNDIKKAAGHLNSGATFISEGGSYSDGNIKVKAYGSTDCGVSFWVEICGFLVFHAGDLNNWHWNEQSPPNEAAASNNAFLQKLKAIKSEREQADVVMFPVDPRLGKDCGLGAEQFITEIKTKLFVPMHFWGNYDKANEFKQIAEKHGCDFFTITKTGDSINI